MAALPPAVLTHDHPRSLVPVLGGALPSSPLRDERSRGATDAVGDFGRMNRVFITCP
jgi:hypothetical protein